MKVLISVANRRADVLRCQYFIAENYNQNYAIMFSEDIYDLEARIEPYPHRYIMATVEGELVAAMGLYTRDTYVERYAGVTEEEIAGELARCGVAEQYAGAVKREMTKLVVKDGWTGRGLARLLHDVGHARAFIDADAGGPVVILVCARRSVYNSLFAPRGVVDSHFLAPFPRYPVHSAYRSEADPMETRVTIPAIDVPQELRDLPLPFETELAERATKKGG